MSVEHAPGRTTRIRFYLAIWLFVLSAIAFMDRANIAIAGLRISHEYGLGNLRLGWIASAFLLGYAGFQLPGGWMAARFGPRRVLTMGVLLWAIATGLTALLPPGMSHAIVLLMLCRFILGAGESVMYPSANQFVARWIPVGERGKINGLIFAGVGAGSGLTPPLLNWIISRYGWRASFWLAAGLFTLAGLVWWVISRDTPQEHPSVSQAELATIENGLPAAASAAGRSKISWAAIFSRRDLFAMMAAYFSFGYIAWVFFSWFFIYMAQERHIDLKKSALLTMLPPLSMMVCSMVGGIVSDKLTVTRGLRVGRCSLAVVSLLLTAALLVVGAHAKSALVAGLILAAGAGAMYLSQSSFWSASADIAGRSTGVYSSMVNMGGQIGGAVSASLTPWIGGRFGWMTAFGFAASLAVLGALCWMTVHPERPLEVEA